MRLEKISWAIGGCLLAGAFLVSAVQVLRYEQRERDQTVLRLSHYHLETGAREAFDAIARAYEARNPGITVQPIAVPKRLYLTWIRTRLVGGNAPDLVETFGEFEELLPRYFEPLGKAIREPNPYDPPREDQPAWRASFHDGLTSQPSYSYNLLENYSIPLATASVRVFFNVDLYRQLTGHENPPQTFDEFLDLCARASSPVDQGGLGRPALAGSRQTSDWLLNLVFSHATQRLTREIEPTRRMTTPGLDWQAAFLRGQWDLDTPDIRHALGLIRSLGRFLPPGFLQLQPEDALLAFAQGRSLFIVAASHDASSLRAESPFQVGAFRLPLPPPSEFSIGPVAEVSAGSPASFVVNRSGQSAQAIDFLRFLTSPEAAAIFSRLTGWPSSVSAVVPDPDLALFMPEKDGYPSGLVLNFGGSAGRVYTQNLHLLVNEDGSVEKFVQAIAPDYREAIRDDLARGVRQILQNVTVLDSVLGASWPRPDHPDLAAAQFRAAVITESQTLQEEATYRRRHALLTAK